MTGIPLPEPAALRDDVRELLPLIAPPGREPARTMRLLALQPELLGPFLGWAAALALRGALPKRDQEILALRVAHNCASDYELWEHADDNDLSEGEIRDLQNSEDAQNAVDRITKFRIIPRGRRCQIVDEDIFPNSHEPDLWQRSKEEFPKLIMQTTGEILIRCTVEVIIQ